MNVPLKAGERLAPDQHRLRPPPPPPRDRGPAPRGPAPGSGGPLRWLGRVVGALAGLFVVAALIGLAGAYGAYRLYTADLPDVEGLKHYQPRVMSRIYASDGELMAELAT